MSSKHLKSQAEMWGDSFANHLVSEIFRLVKSQTETRGAEFTRGMFPKVIARLVGSYLFSALKTPVNAGTEEGAFTQALHHFSVTKLEVQDAIALGFQTAMSMHSGVPAEYYCQIKLVPPMKTEKVN